MMVLALFHFLLFSLTKADPLSQTCIAEMGDKLNISSFAGSVAHGVHSMTVEDARFYFDPNIGDKIKIPTINQNISGNVLLEYLPFANYDHAFTTMALKNLDIVMRNIGKEDWSIRGLNTLEKISHVLHMQALWKKAGEVYKQYIKNPPKNAKFCSCITDIGQNEILEALIQMAERIRGEELDMNTVRKGLRIKRSPEAKRLYNTFNGGPNYRTFYSDFSAKEFQREKRSPYPKKMDNHSNWPPNLYSHFDNPPPYRNYYYDFSPKRSISNMQKRSPEAKRMYNTFEGGPNYRTFYSDFSAKEFQREKRSPNPKKMYNTFNGGPNYRTFYSDFDGKEFLSKIQKRSPEAKRMYNTFNGGPNYREFYSDFSGKKSLSNMQKRSPEAKRMYNTFEGGPNYRTFYSDFSAKELFQRQKRSPEPKKMYNTFNGGPNYRVFYSDFSGNKSLSNIQKRSPEAERMYNTFDGGPNYRTFYSDFSAREPQRAKRSPEPRKMYNTFDGGPNYRTFYSDFSAREPQRAKRSPEPRKMYNTFNGGPKYEYFYSDYNGEMKSLSNMQKRSPEPRKMYNTFDGGPKYEYFYSDYKARGKSLSDMQKRSIFKKRSSDSDINQRKTEASKDPEMPQLTDSESWKKWKSMLQRSMMKEDAYTNLAAFMYCSLKNDAIVV